jgi:hypothetical protein
MDRELVMLAAISIVLACGALASQAGGQGIPAGGGEAAPAAAPVTATEAADAITLENGLVRVCYDVKEKTVRIDHAGKVFVTKGALWPEVAVDGAKAAVVDCRDALGSGKAILITAPDDRTQTLRLYEGLPLVCTSIALKNEGKEPLNFTTLVPFKGSLCAGDPADLRLFGCDGLGAADKKGKTSYGFLAVVNPTSRRGIVAGWLTHNRASGIVGGSVEEGMKVVTLEAQAQYGRLTVPAGQALEGDTLALGWFDDCLDGLETFASAVARANAIKLPKVPSGYCTWYHARALDEKRMATLAQFCKDSKLTDYGFEFLQIDDGWQVGSRDFTDFNPKGKYAGGMKATADAIRAGGMTAGLWFIPFGWSQKDPSLANHLDWFVHTKDGKVYNVKWAGDCLDMTHPEARKFLAECVGRMCRDWGYKYIKIDGLWTGLAAGILYPSPTYRDEGFGDAVFHDPAVTNLQAYRDGLRLVREAAGKDVFILGCNIAQNMRTMGGSFGLVDGMRVGADIGANWKSITGTAVPQATRLYFWNSRVWWNDPDCLMLRAPLTADEARAWGSLIAVSGQLNVVSEWLPDLPPEKLEVVRRTMPGHGRCGRPLDLFDAKLAQVWHLQAGEGDGRRDIVGLFQWDEKAAGKLSVEIARLGLPAGAADKYVGFDFWENQFVPAFATSKEFEMRPGSCRVLSIVRALERPQLVSTSRHVTQGLVDVSAVAWDAAKLALGGKSKVVSGDPYELRIVAGPYKASAAVVSEADRAAGVTAEARPDGQNLRVTIKSPTTREVAWEVKFGK